MLCCSNLTADFTADLNMRAFVSFVNVKVAERPSQRNLFFPAFSPFSQKRPTAAVLQTLLGLGF